MLNFVRLNEFPVVQILGVVCYFKLFFTIGEKFVRAAIKISIKKLFTSKHLLD